jgi:SAM-dependent methyltransferase
MDRERVCPICHSTIMPTFLEIKDVPVHIGLLWLSKDSAKKCPRGNINLGFCHACGFIYNLAFEPHLLEYDQAYDNSLDFSSHFQDYARLLASRLIKQYDLFNKELIEIGCGKGHFIRLLCELGGNRGVGFDPANKPKSDDSLSEQVTFIAEIYSERYSALQADFICCRHVLEHIENPVGFLCMLRNNIGERLKTAIYFEVPNVLFTLRNLAIWDIIYEHCSYYCSQSLLRAFTASGFRVCELSETYEGQWLAIEAFPSVPSEDVKIAKKPFDPPSKIIYQNIIKFADDYHEKLRSWRENLERIARSGQRAVVWGAGAKGVSFLNILKVQDQIDYVVDINPHKQGRYIAGTGQQIVSPEFLQSYQPDILIIMNQVYEKEIRNMMNKLGLEPKYFYA